MHNDLVVSFRGCCLGCMAPRVNRWPPKYRIPMVQHHSGDYSHPASESPGMTAAMEN